MPVSLSSYWIRIVTRLKKLSRFSPQFQYGSNAIHRTASPSQITFGDHILESDLCSTLDPIPRCKEM